MIKTKKFSIDPTVYFKIVVKQHLTKSWWLYLILFSFAIYNLMLPDRFERGIVGIAIGIGYMAAISIYLYFWTTSTKNKIYFVDREVTFDGDKMICHSDTGIRSEIPIKHILKVVDEKEALLLFITRSQFHYVKKEAFYSSQDLDTFSKAVKDAVINNKS